MKEEFYCDKCKANRKVVNVEQLPNKKQLTLDCGHSWGKIVNVVNETMGITEDTSWIILRDPVAEVRKAINEKDYFKTVTYACSVFEYCGQQILIWDSEMKDNTNPLTVEEVSGWSLHNNRDTSQAENNS
jgi:hypothetical protein